LGIIADNSYLAEDSYPFHDFPVRFHNRCSRGS
jgi:hypothetical protein